MQVNPEDQLLVCTGGTTPTVFKHRIRHSMTNEISYWLQQTYKGGYGHAYYYSHGEIWFRKAAHETLFLLKWSK